MNDNTYPSHKSTDPEGRHLRYWFTYQRQQYKKGELSQAQIRRFESEMPGWSWDRVKDKKKELLKMARKGAPRPKDTTKLGQSLGDYTCKSSQSYDLKFNQEIRKLAPHWWVNTANENKKKLLEIARKGEPRPLGKTKLGQALINYTYRISDNLEFNNKLKKLAPSWFVNTADENKKKLLQMAQIGERRPHWKTKSGRTLVSYTCKTCGKTYDAEFDKKIRKLAPRWFINTADETKKKLLEMVRKNEPRPRKRKSQLGRSLCRYTNKGHAYDPDFDKKIRQLNPHWFKRAS